MNEQRAGRAGARHTAGYVLVALLALGAFGSLPFALASLIGDLQTSDNRVFYATDPTFVDQAAFRLHLDFAGLARWSCWRRPASPRTATRTPSPWQP